MSEPVELIEQELALIKQIDEIANEQYMLKAIRKMNNAQVRGWRLNIMRRVQRVQEEITGVFDEDTHKQLNVEIEALNNEIQTFGTIEFDNAIKLTGQSREVREKIIKLERKLDGKVNTEPLTEIKAKFLTRINDNRNFLAEQKRKQKEVEEENKVIEEDNKNLEAENALFRAEARDYVDNINKRLGWVSDDGKFAIFNEDSEEIEEYSVENVANSYAETIVNQNDPMTYISGFPDDLYDELYDEAIDDPEFLSDKVKVYQKLQNYFNLEVAKEEKPEKPIIELENLKNVPEIQPAKIKVNDIVIPQLSQSTILSGNKIPDEIVEELQSYRVGKYELTMQNASRINELAEKYNLLKIKIIPQQEKASTRAINQKIRELISVQNSFGSERNSRTGQTKIKVFIEATRNFLRHTRNQQAVFEASYHEFMNAAQDLKDWINRAWWQFGGQPENHHGAGKGDNSQVTREGKMKTNYSGPSL